MENKNMHKSVQDFLQIAPPYTYFETTLGRFIFASRVQGGLGYLIWQQAVGGKWKTISAFKVRGELQPGKQGRVILYDSVETGENCD